jgi:transcriptional regulator with XRE-family HTH domain
MAQPLSPSQIRAARGLLNWSRVKLASHARVSELTIHRFENSINKPDAKTEHKIRHALERAGINFTADDGVARRRDDITVVTGQTDAIYYMFDDIYNTVKDKGGEIFVSGVDERMFDKYAGEGDPHDKRMIAIKDKVSLRCLLQEGDYYLPYEGHFFYRWMPKDQFESVPFYLWGNKLAILQDRQDELEILIIHSPSIASAFKKQFDFMWERCREVPRKKKLK